MPTYKAKANAEASVTAQFFFRRAETVTATASATAESNISKEEAYNIALSIAQEVAQSAAQNDANVIIQSVNTSTLGDNTIFLDSSLLNGYLEKIGDNVFKLIKKLNIPRLLKLIIGIKETLIIDGLEATMKFDNFGTIKIVNGGKLTIGGAPETNSTTKSESFLEKIKGVGVKASDTPTTTTNNFSSINLVGSSLIVSSGETYNNNGEITGVGVSTIINQGTFINTPTINPNVNSPGTIDIALIVNEFSFTNNGSVTAYNSLVQIGTPMFKNFDKLICGAIYNPNNISDTLINESGGTITIQ